MELEGQVAIVTGAGRGIGRATALELGRMGSDIVVAEVNRENTERTASQVRGLALSRDGGADGRHVPQRSRGHGRADARRVWSD